jgi:hypothetical protein
MRNKAHADIVATYTATEHAARRRALRIRPGRDQPKVAALARQHTRVLAVLALDGRRHADGRNTYHQSLHPALLVGPLEGDGQQVFDGLREALIDKVVERLDVRRRQV